jgi:hypothetical protein
MNQHLSSKQIVEWMIEDRTVEAERHVEECAECAAQVNTLRESLGMFRGAVRETAGNLADRRIVDEVPRRRMAVLWLTAAAALVTITVLPIYKVKENRQKAEIVRQDAELMEQVNAGLSEGVAAPMKPLEKMVKWGPAAEARSF